jgi:hypothetical protein
MPWDGTLAVHDVLRWREPVWKPKGRKKSKPVVIGERLLTAELKSCDGDWLEFKLMDSVTTNAELWWKRIPELKSDKPLRRKRSTLMKRKPERLPWGGTDGEDVRPRTMSRFLK